MPIERIEMKNGVSVEIKVPHMKYVDKVLTRHSYEEMMWLFGKSNEPSKEISESYGAFHNLKKVTDLYEENIQDYDWFHIADGRYTRGAFLFTMMSKSRNISIDPAINMEFVQNIVNKYSIRNFEFYNQRFEDYIADFQGEFRNPKQYGIVCMHAHVDLKEVDRLFPDWTYLLTCPCCFPKKQTFSQKYMAEHGIEEVMRRDDYGILSALREVVIYVKGDKSCQN